MTAEEVAAFKARCDNIVTGLIEGATREETMEILLAHVLSHLENPFDRKPARILSGAGETIGNALAIVRLNLEALESAPRGNEPWEVCEDMRTALDAIALVAAALAGAKP